MNGRQALLALAICAMAAPLGFAQPQVPANFTVQTVAVGIPASGHSMAVDLWGNIYIVEIPVGPTITGPVVVRVEANGTIHAPHATGLSHPGELAQNPCDGQVYLVDTSPILPVVQSRVLRMNPVGGSTVAFHVPVVAEGMTIDNDGRYIFGASQGPQGPGLYRWTQVSPTGPIVFDYLGAGFGQNKTLASLINGDILIADGNQVRRWSPLLPGVAPYYQAPPTLPNSFTRIPDIDRGPMNELGKGAMVALRHLNTLCLCGDSRVLSGNLVGGNTVAPFAHEAFSFPFEGLTAIASGVRQDLYWYTVGQGIVAGYFGQLSRIRQESAHGSPGSLIATNLPGHLVLDVYGPVPGNDPFLYGIATNNASDLFAKWLGLINLNPFDPGYIPILDGVGVFGPPNPFARTGPGGHFQLTIQVPPSIPAVFRSQALLVSTIAPNATFYISNVEPILIP